MERLIEEGKAYQAYYDLTNIPYHPPVMQRYAKWSAGCCNFIRLLGDAGQDYKEIFQESYGRAIPSAQIGTLEHLQLALRSGLLGNTGELVRAEVFLGLLEQAECLNESGYFIAAGVLARAVLQEHLKAWAEQACVILQTDQPTLDDFTGALHESKIYPLTVMKHIEAMAAIGNSATHNKEELTQDEVTQLLTEVRDFVCKHL
ncbi:MAG: hypothetical protein JWO08_565 [Verrucomicrobiaceae bacterium]|nr:hypothetical protein [Verrucomicrobiaceae bacterium]